MTSRQCWWHLSNTVFQMTDLHLVCVGKLFIDILVHGAIERSCQGMALRK